MTMSLKFICFGAACAALSACSVPNYTEPKAATFQPAATAKAPAQVAKKPAYTAPATTQATVTQQQAAVETPVEEEVKPKNPWAHQRIGNTPSLSDSDEDGGWG